MCRGRTRWTRGRYPGGHVPVGGAPQPGTAPHRAPGGTERAGQSCPFRPGPPGSVRLCGRTGPLLCRRGALCPTPARCTLALLRHPRATLLLAPARLDMLHLPQRPRPLPCPACCPHALCLGMVPPYLSEPALTPNFQSHCWPLQQPAPTIAPLPRVDPAAHLAPYASPQLCPAPLPCSCPTAAGAPSMVLGPRPVSLNGTPRAFGQGAAGTLGELYLNDFCAVGFLAPPAPTDCLLPSPSYCLTFLGTSGQHCAP